MQKVSSNKNNSNIVIEEREKELTAWFTL